MGVPTSLPTASPVISDPLGNGYANITALAEAVASRLELEHTTVRNGQSPTDHEGLHKQGSAIAFFQETTPASRRNSIAFATGTDDEPDDRGLFWIKPMPSLAAMTYVELYVYTGDTDTEINPTAPWSKLNRFGTTQLDTIVERTENAGVTIEGVHLENDETLDDDSVAIGPSIDGVNRVTVNKLLKIGAAGDCYSDGIRVACRALKLGTKPASPENGDIWME